MYTFSILLTLRTPKPAAAKLSLLPLHTPVVCVLFGDFGDLVRHVYGMIELVVRAALQVAMACSDCPSDGTGTAAVALCRCSVAGSLLVLLHN